MSPGDDGIIPITVLGNFLNTTLLSMQDLMDNILQDVQFHTEGFRIFESQSMRISGRNTLSGRNAKESSASVI